MAGSAPARWSPHRVTTGTAGPHRHRRHRWRRGGGCGGRAGTVQEVRDAAGARPGARVGRRGRGWRRRPAGRTGARPGRGGDCRRRGRRRGVRWRSARWPAGPGTPAGHRCAAPATGPAQPHHCHPEGPRRRHEYPSRSRSASSPTPPTCGSPSSTPPATAPGPSPVGSPDRRLPANFTSVALAGSLLASAASRNRVGVQARRPYQVGSGAIRAEAASPSLPRTATAIGSAIATVEPELARRVADPRVGHGGSAVLATGSRRPSAPAVAKRTVVLPGGAAEPCRSPRCASCAERRARHNRCRGQGDRRAERSSRHMPTRRRRQRTESRPTVEPFPSAGSGSVPVAPRRA